MRQPVAFPTNRTGTISRRRLRRAPHVSPVVAGSVLALLAVLGQTYFDVYPPAAYGFCTACHGRDLIDAAANAIFGTHLAVAGASAIFPLLTVLGVLVGSALAAGIASEWRWQRSRMPLRDVVLGFSAIVCALTVSGCMVRLVLRAAYVDPSVFPGLIGAVLGAVLATVLLRGWARR